MCIFTGPIDRVGATRIFARTEPGGTQVLAYQMRLSASDDVAMVLPLPVPAGAPDDAVELISLADHPQFFDDLAKLFSFGMAGAAPGAPRAHEAPLRVERVGAFDASFVPSPAAFSRLDPRFQIEPDIWAALPKYADWGFAVFQLRAGHGLEVHPMALRFPTRYPGWLYFPTVHVHDGQVHQRATFEHVLYGQRLPGADRPESIPGPWRFGSGQLPLPERFTARDFELQSIEHHDELISARLAGRPPRLTTHPPRRHWEVSCQTGWGSILGFGIGGLVDRALPIHRVALTGELSNADFAVPAAGDPDQAAY